MRIIIFFDLPVACKDDRKNYAIFRKELIKQGFDMLQYSVYVRVARNYDDAKKHVDRVKRILPPAGSVRVLVVTEKQYSSMVLLLGEKTASEKFLTSEEIIEL